MTILPPIVFLIVITPLIFIQYGLFLIPQCPRLIASRHFASIYSSGKPRISYAIPCRRYRPEKFSSVRSMGTPVCRGMRDIRSVLPVRFLPYCLNLNGRNTVGGRVWKTNKRSLLCERNAPASDGVIWRYFEFLITFPLNLVHILKLPPH